MGEVKNILPDGVMLTPLKIIGGDSGSVLHGLKASEESFVSFGEAYFSTVKGGHKKGWKKHLQMTLNLVVPAGEIGFVIFDDRSISASRGELFNVVLSRNNYQRLTVAPGLWMAFYGVGAGENILLNIASIPHDPAEVETLPIDTQRIPYSWV